ncbi:MAG TPA: alpha/beta hydrolase-fold protein [Pyrinomonadaceae bacterium]|nr:alpha/beta hydrolase-fold protein [Pyrinomonadaceae bacterium]
MLNKIQAGSFAGRRFKRAVASLLLLIFIVPAALAQEGRIVRELVHGASLEGNVTGEATDRNVSIYLPPSYERAPAKRYPVVYLLHGIGDTDKTYTSPWRNQTAAWGTIQGLMNNGVAEGRFAEMIVVMPDQRTKMFGSFYTNSTATGNWEDFTFKDLVNYIDRKYRTLARAESRGIAGHSMGGHGALKVGMKHPEVFSVVYALNPAVLGWGADVSLENPAFVAVSKMTTLEEVMRGGIYSVGALCVAQAFSPNPARPPFYADLPYKMVDGKPQPSEPAYSKWTENMPLHMVAAHKANLSRLRGLRFDTGWEDEFTHIPPTTRALARKLTELGVEHIFEEYNGDHRNRLWGRTGRLYTEVLPYFSLLLDSREAK